MFKLNLNAAKLILVALIVFLINSSISYAQSNYDWIDYYNSNNNYNNYNWSNNNNWENNWGTDSSYSSNFYNYDTNASSYSTNYYPINYNYDYSNSYVQSSYNWSNNNNWENNWASNSSYLNNSYNYDTNASNYSINYYPINYDYSNSVYYSGYDSQNNLNFNKNNYQDNQYNQTWTNYNYNPGNFYNYDFNSSNYYNNYYDNSYSSYSAPNNQNQQTNLNNNQNNYYSQDDYASNYDYFNNNSTVNFLNSFNSNYLNNLDYKNEYNYNINSNSAINSLNYQELNFFINQTEFNLNDSWILNLEGAPANQEVIICAIHNNNQSCSWVKDLGLQATTDSNGKWFASGSWGGDESVLGTWTEWVYVGGSIQNGEVVGGIKSNNITFTISKQILSTLQQSQSSLQQSPQIQPQQQLQIPPQQPPQTLPQQPPQTSPQNSSLGVYIWGDLPKTNSPLKTSVDDALSLGAKTVRIAISPCYWDPQGISSNPEPLYNEILRDDYSYVFKNFSTVMVTIYPLSICDPNSGQPYYRLSSDIISESKWQEILNNVYNEIKQTVIAAKINYPNTTVIWSNWEMENDCQDNQWQRCVEYQKTRLKAINDASLETQNFGGTGKEYSAIEFVLLEKNWVPQWKSEWGPSPEPRVNSGLITAVEDLKGLWDFISYSSWNSIYYTEDPNWRPNKKFTEAFNTIRQACYNAGINCSDKIIIGEVGTLYDQDTNNSLLYEAISTSMKEGAKFIYNWNLYDQIAKGTLITPDGKQYDQSKFGKFDLNRTLTSQGKIFKEWLFWLSQE